MLASATILIYKRRELGLTMLHRNKTPITYAAELTLENVQHFYGARQILHDISFTLKAGEVVCLLGPSGCGKSTLLRLIAGLECTDGGSVRINGKVMCDANTCVPTQKRNIGMVFQDYALFPHFTVLQNVAYGLRSVLGNVEAENEAMRALERVGLAHAAQKSPIQLSGGERQRVALARSVVTRPSILLMDEPFSGLDGRLKEAIRRETLQVLREANVTTLIVTHDPEEAMRIADRLILMDEGRIVAHGQAETLYRAPPNVFTASFLSETVVQNVTVAHGQISTMFGVFMVDGCDDGTKLSMAVHPHDVQLSAAQRIGCQHGKINQCSFAGDHYHYDIRLAASDDMLMCEGRTREAIGQVVWLYCNAENVMLFDATTQERLPLHVRTI